jgi:hypothetical protein
MVSSRIKHILIPKRSERSTSASWASVRARARHLFPEGFGVFSTCYTEANDRAATVAAPRPVRAHGAFRPCRRWPCPILGSLGDGTPRRGRQPGPHNSPERGKLTLSPAPRNQIFNPDNIALFYRAPGTGSACVAGDAPGCVVFTRALVAVLGPRDRRGDCGK